MKALVFLFAVVFVVICGAWLFTSEHSPLVSSLGIGAEGDFDREARAQIASLTDIRENAARAANNRRNRHEWEGRFQHVSVRLLRDDPDYDAEGTVRYYAIDPRGGDSHDCEDVFRRKRSNSKWELVSDPGADERQRLQSGRDTQSAEQSVPASPHDTEADQYRAALQSFLQSLQPFESELRNIENAKRAGCTLVDFSQHVQMLIAAYGQIAPATTDFPKLIVHGNDGYLLTTDYANQARELAKTILQGESTHVQLWNSLIDQQVQGNISRDECSMRISKALSDTKADSFLAADDAARQLLGASDLSRWVVGSSAQLAAQKKLELEVTTLHSDTAWASSTERRAAYVAWSEYMDSTEALEQVANTITSIQDSIKSATSLAELAQLNARLNATGPQMEQVFRAKEQASGNLQRQPRATIVAVGEDLSQDGTLSPAHHELIQSVLSKLRL